MNEFLLPIQKRLQQRPPQIAFPQCRFGWTDPSARRVERGRVTEHAYARRRVQAGAEIARVPWAYRQLVGINNRERIERIIVERPLHAIEREGMQMSPGKKGEAMGEVPHQGA